MRRLRLAVLVTATAFSAGRAAAQQPLTLDEAIGRALAAHPSITAAAERASAANARRRDARSAIAPRISLEEGWQRTDQPVLAFGFLLAQRRFTADNFAIDALNHPAPVSNHRFGVAVDQLLFDGGRTSAAVRAANARAQAADADATRARADLTLDVSRAFSRTMAAAASVASARAASQTAAADLSLITDRRNAGLETDAALLLAQGRADAAEADVIAAVADEQIARAALNSLMDEPLDTAFALVPPSLEIPADADVSALTAGAIRTRPEVIAATEAERAAEAALTEARRALQVPSVRAMGGIEANGATFGDRSSSWVAGVFARWSISTAGGDGARIAAATADLEAARAARRLSESAVSLDVTSALARARSARSRELATRRVVDDAKEAQRITRNRYEAGLASATELARAAEQVAGAERLRTAALAEVIAASAELDHATGKGEHR